MNYCIAIPFPPCLPPLITFNEGHGIIIEELKLVFVKVWRCWYKGIFFAAAPALANAKETANMAFAPNLFLHQPN